MNPFAVIFGLILLAISVFFVASPLAHREPVKKVGVRKSFKDERVSQEQHRQAVILALRDLDFDYQAGKVTEEDYQPLRTGLLTEAALLLEKHEREKDDEIETLIQSRRKAKEPAPQQAACHHCHSPLLEGAKFCSKCGNPVEEVQCPQCKQTLHAGDRFCPACGAGIEEKKQLVRSAPHPKHS
jgi:RNA polymerase subunit RPABC4/transcription elongation factor Spt4